MFFQVAGDPHPWPLERQTPSTACAVLVVDMQHDYCSPGYYIHQAGYDTQRLSRPIPLIRQVLSVAHQNGVHVIYTRHGHVTRDGSTLSQSSFPVTAASGEPGWQIVPALTPQPPDRIIEKSTCSAFVSGELDQMLRQMGIRHLAFCGNTIDVCVHSSLRSAVDLGYECLLLADCCGAVNDGLHRWALESVKIENGVFGTVANAADFISAFERRADSGVG